MGETDKLQPRVIVNEETPKEEAPPTMSGKQPSPYTAMRQKSVSSSRAEQMNCDAEYARREFHALANRTMTSTALAQLAVPHKRASGPR
jgi:hypothetical protein